MIKKHTRVEVQWADATSVGGWQSPDDEHPPISCVTMGYVWEDKPDYISVVQTQASNGDVGGVFTIPRGMVLKVKRIK